MDVKDIDKLKNAIETGNYDMVINAIGILPKSINDKLHEGVWINSYLPHYLAYITKSLKTKVIHLSTDCVFSGREGKYNENNYCDADDYYGRTKALGEINDSKNLTFRMSIVGPDINVNGVGLMNWFINQDKKVYGYKNAIWSGVTTITLAEAIIESFTQNLTGLYHLVNNNFINKYEMLQLFNNIRVTPVIIEPEESYCVDKSMVNNRTDFDFIVPSYTQMFNDIGKWIHEHNQLYSHYFSKI